MDDFPTIVYRCPGQHVGMPGTTYSAIGVTDSAEKALRLMEGWFATLPEATDAFLNVPAPAEPAPVDPAPDAPGAPDESPVSDAPPTREEMLVQAAKIGLRVDSRWGNATLLSKINELTPKGD
jgi:hypothetical protein